MLATLDSPRPGDVRVDCFTHRDGDYLFGLVPDGEPPSSVTLQPNDVMFHPPWDGEFST